MKSLIGIIVGGLLVATKTEVWWEENLRGPFCFVGILSLVWHLFKPQISLNLILFGCHSG